MVRSSRIARRASLARAAGVLRRRSFVVVASTADVQRRAEKDYAGRGVEPHAQTSRAEHES
jgi:hypothetical protein